MQRNKQQRLGAEDWLKAGLAALCSDGPDLLKAEPLARRIGTTKGSFYWHFKDVHAFHERLLSDWEERAAAPAQDSVENPVLELRSSLQHIVETLPGAEVAIRAWAQANPHAKVAVSHVDTARLEHLENLLSQIGISNPEMARILYSAAIGMASLQSQSEVSDRESIGSLVDLILALR